MNTQHHQIIPDEKPAGPLSLATLICSLVAVILFGIVFLFHAVAPNPAPGSPMQVLSSIAFLAIFGLVLTSLITGITSFCTGRWTKHDVIGVSIAGLVILLITIAVAAAASGV